MEENNQSSNAVSPVSPVAQTPPIQTPPVLKHKSKLPLLIIGVILFLLIAGSAAGFYAFKPQIMKLVTKPTPTPIQIVQRVTPTPSPDPTANWKTVDGKSFSIKIPPQWNAKTEPNEITVDSGTGLYLKFNTIIGQITESTISNKKAGIASQLNVRKVTIDGKSVNEYFGCANAEACEVIHYVLLPISSNEYLSVEFVDNDPLIGNTPKNPIFDQILSTLKFTGDKSLNSILELNGFPIYAGAEFIKKSPRITCTTQAPPDSNCYNDSYEYSINTPFSDIYHWYLNLALSGWKCGGGAGSLDDTIPSAGNSTTSCTNGTISYFLIIKGDTKSTNFIVEVPAN